MVSTSSYLQPSLPPQPSQLWATLTKQEDRIIEVTKEDDDDEIDELVGEEEGMVMGRPPKLQFGFELDDTHALSQVSLAGRLVSEQAQQV